MRYSSTQREEVVVLYGQGLSTRAIHARIGMSVPYINRLLHDAGVTLRPAGFQPRNPSRTGRPHTQETIALCRARKAHLKNPVLQFFDLYRRGAKKRNLEFSLTVDEFTSLIRRTCDYCGAPPESRWINTSKLTCHGIDRIDSAEGYTPQNCVAACKVCNRMKSAHGRREFINHCRAIVRHQDSK